jgi:hypothetical protein
MMQQFFSTMMAKAKGQLYQDILNSAQAHGPQGTPNKHNHSNCTTKFSRLSKLWVPIRKKLALEGIRVGSEIIRESRSMMEVLSRKWAPTFQKKL